MRPTREQDPLLVDTFDAISVVVIFALIALVVAFFPKPLPSPRGDGPAPRGNTADGTAGRSSKRVPLPTEAERRLMVTSWYGRPYHGRPTASGEIFDREAFTAAHRTLAFGTRLRLSVAGRSCVVTINDRGPVHPGRDLDVSEAVAEQLGMIDVGVAILEARVL